jgi:hypothetical protein
MIKMIHNRYSIIFFLQYLNYKELSIEENLTISKSRIRERNGDLKIQVKDGTSHKYYSQAYRD